MKALRTLNRARRWYRHGDALRDELRHAGWPWKGFDAMRLVSMCTALFFLAVPATSPAQPIPLARNQIKLTASDGQVGDRFGSAVAISGETVLVGAPQHGGAGVAYFYSSRDSERGRWAEITKIEGGDLVGGDSFGLAVALDGDTAVVGAPQQDPRPGAVYIFERDVSGTESWGQVKKLVPADVEPGDAFGWSVSLRGDTLVVGTPHGAVGGLTSGSAYVFERDAGGTGNWGEVKRVFPSDPSENARFGHDVAVDGHTLLVGASNDGEVETEGGAAYVFERDEGGVGNWGEVRKLTEADLDAYDRFGSSVAVEGNTALVGASPGAAVSQFGASIFERDSGGSENWGQVKQLNGGGQSARFGSDVVIRDDTSVVGARLAHGVDFRTGAAFAFERDHQGLGEWGEVARLIPPDGESSDGFGVSVAMGEGGVVVVGSPFDGVVGEPLGAAYVFPLRASCPQTPMGACVSSWVKGSLIVKEKKLGKAKLSLTLRKGPALSQGSFGNPLEPGGTSYDLCIYRGDGSLAAWLRSDRPGMQCSGKDCWRPWRGIPPGGLGFRYRDKEVESDGLFKVDFKGGLPGQSAITVRASNSGRVAFPFSVTDSLANTESVTAQFFGSDFSTCFSVTLDHVTKNDGAIFMAR